MAAKFDKTKAIVMMCIAWLLDPSKFVGAVFASILAAAIVSMLSIYWGNGLSLSTFSSMPNGIDRDLLHTSFAGRVLFFTVQAASWGAVVWPVVVSYKVICKYDPSVAFLSFLTTVISVPISFFILQIAGWLAFNDKTIFMRDWAYNLSSGGS